MFWLDKTTKILALTMASSSVQPAEWPIRGSQDVTISRAIPKNVEAELIFVTYVAKFGQEMDIQE